MTHRTLNAIRNRRTATTNRVAARIVSGLAIFKSGVMG